MVRLIDADKFIETAWKKLDMNDSYLPVDIKEHVLDKMPTVDAKPIVKGRWLKTNIHSTSGDKPALFYCSECNMCVPFPTPYCPFCGTSMLGERRYDGDTKC